MSLADEINAGYFRTLAGPTLEELFDMPRRNSPGCGKQRRKRAGFPKVQAKHQRRYGGKGWRCLGQKMKRP